MVQVIKLQNQPKSQHEPERDNPKGHASPHFPLPLKAKLIWFNAVKPFYQNYDLKEIIFFFERFIVWNEWFDLIKFKSSRWCCLSSIFSSYNSNNICNIWGAFIWVQGIYFVFYFLLLLVDLLQSLFFLDIFSIIKLKGLKVVLKKLNKEVFGFINTKRNQFLTEIPLIDQMEELGPSYWFNLLIES